MRLRVFPSESELAEAAAAHLAEGVRSRAGGVLGLATGRTPLPIYRRWTEHHAPGSPELAGLRVFGLDELCGLPPGHAATFRRYLEAQVATPLQLAPEQLRTFPTAQDSDPAAFEVELEQAGGLDLLFLGLGANGHVAFNEPGASLDARAHRAVLNDTTRRANAWLFPTAEDVPTEAFTLGMGALLRAKEILLVATGAAKGPALARSVEGRVTAECPASFLQLHPRCEVWADAAAARDMTGQ